MRFVATVVAVGGLPIMVLTMGCGGNGDGEDPRSVVVRGVATLPAQLGGEQVTNAPCELADLRQDPRGTVVVDESMTDDTGVWSMQMNRSVLAEVRCTTDVPQAQGTNLKVRGLAIPDDPEVAPDQEPVIVQKNIDGVTTVATVAGLGALQQAAQQEQSLESSDGDGTRGQRTVNLTAEEFDQQRIENLEEGARRRIKSVDFTDEDSINFIADRVVTDTSGGSRPPPEPEPEPRPQQNVCGDLCCPGRDDTCSPSGVSCFCDEFCATREPPDCCDDFDGVCPG